MGEKVPGYFRMPPAEIGATLIFVPRFTKGVCAIELAMWGKDNGFGDIAYVPAKVKKEQVVNAAS